MMIKRVTKVKYLRLVVDENLSWDEHFRKKLPGE